jgi:hypothetical protein
MPRSSAACPHCSERLNIGTRGLFLDAEERPVTDWRRAAWKTCSTCSTLAGSHVFLPWPTAYGIEGTRTLNGEVLPENNCSLHRNAAEGENREFDRRECTATGVAAPKAGGRTATARPPTRRPARGPADGDADAPWSDDDIKSLVRVLVGMPLDEEGQRKLVEHVRLERSARTRQHFLEERRRQGRGRCDGCAEDLAQKYDSTFSDVVEVHHRVPLWKGVQRATSDALALLCPTCHRVVHFRQKEPRAVEEVARLVRRSR